MRNFCMLLRYLARSRQQLFLRYAVDANPERIVSLGNRNTSAPSSRVWLNYSLPARRPLLLTFAQRRLHSRAWSLWKATHGITPSYPACSFPCCTTQYLSRHLTHQLRLSRHSRLSRPSKLFKLYWRIQILLRLSFLLSYRQSQPRYMRSSALFWT